MGYQYETSSLALRTRKKYCLGLPGTKQENLTVSIRQVFRKIGLEITVYKHLHNFPDSIPFSDHLEACTCDLLPIATFSWMEVFSTRDEQFFDCEQIKGRNASMSYREQCSWIPLFMQIRDCFEIAGESFLVINDIPLGYDGWFDKK